jgi:membrane protease YdiL (CAAX protease family)
MGMLEDAVGARGIMDQALVGGSVDRSKFLAYPSFWDIVRLFFGANIAGLFSAIVPAVGNVPLIWTLAISSSVSYLWIVGRYRHVAELRGWKSLGAQFAPVPGKALLLSIALSAALILLFPCVFQGLEWAGVAISKPPRDTMMSGSAAELPITVLSTVLLAPMAEEFLFRGLLLDWLRHRIPAWAAAISLSICFALAHDNHFKSGAIGWMMFGSRFLLGVAASHLALRFRSLRPSFVLHATNNGIVLIASLFAK